MIAWLNLVRFLAGCILPFQVSHFPAHAGSKATPLFQLTATCIDIVVF